VISVPGLADPNVAKDHNGFETSRTAIPSTQNNNNNNNNDNEFKELQKTAILGTAHIHRKVLV
jgi:hypothetical protein